MEQILTREEIDTLLRRAQSGAAAISPRAQNRRVERFDLRQTGQLSAAQTGGVTALQESFARRTASSLSSFLRVGLEMSLVSVQQVSYGEFLSGLPDLTYLASLRIQSPEARAIIQADLSLVFPIMDLILGGSGKEQTEIRDLTEIEDEIFESAMRIVCHELQAAWAPILEIDLQFDRRVQKAKAASFTLPSEKILSLSFEIRLLEGIGQLNLVFPAVVSNALLRKLSAQTSHVEPAASQKNLLRLREHVLGSRFQLEMMLPPSTVSVREVLKLEPGSILVLQPRSTDPIQLNVEGKNMFMASPIRCGLQRGAQIQKVVSIVAKEGKEAK